MNAVRVLVVDDEKIAARNLQYILSKEGYTVEVALSGPEAITMLEAAVNGYDLVLTDLRMPEVDGMQILATARALHPDVEVIMVTGFATVSSALEAVKAGAYHYVAKPYNISEVRLVVRDALEKRALKQENRQLKEQLAQAQGRGLRT
jgi:DNA-binding NtrC family response regulator